MLLAILVLQSVSSVVVLETQYYGQDCVGRPDSMYVFNVMNIYDYMPYPNETWPPYYSFINEYVSPGSCGDLNVPTPYDCCVGSLNYTDSAPYSSGSPQVLPNVDSITNYLPVQSVNYPYCRIQKHAPYLLSLSGIELIYLSPKNDTCIDGQFKCYSDGRFTIYNETGCTGFHETFALASTNQTLQSALIGSIVGQYIVIPKGDLYYSWVSYIPITLLVPAFNRPSEYVALIFYIFGIILSFGMVALTIYTQWKSGFKYMFVTVVTFICQVCWFVWSIFRLVYWVTIFQTYDALGSIAEVVAVTKGLATLLSCLITNTMIIAVFQLTNKYIQYSLHFMVLCIHVGLAGSGYAAYLMNGGGAGLTVSQFNIVSSWGTASIYWILFMLVWNCTTPVVISLKLLSFGGNTEKVFRRLKKLHSFDPYLFFCLCGQVVVFITYYVIDFLTNHTAVLGNDLEVLNMSAYSTFCLIVHSALTIRIIESLKIVSKMKISTSLQSGSRAATGTSELQSSAVLHKNKTMTTQTVVKKNDGFI